MCGFIRNPCCTSVYASTNSTTSLTVEHLNATYACVYVCFHVLSYRVLLLFVQREGGAQGHVGLRMERSDRDGRIRPPRSADRRLRGGRKQWRGEGVINSTTVHSNVNNKVFFSLFTGINDRALAAFIIIIQLCWKKKRHFQESELCLPFHRHHREGSMSECLRRREFSCAVCSCWILQLKTHKKGAIRKR